MGRIGWLQRSACAEGQVAVEALLALGADRQTEFQYILEEIKAILGQHNLSGEHPEENTYQALSEDFISSVAKNIKAGVHTN